MSNSPNIQVTTAEKDRTVISFGNTENVIKGIEVIRPDESPFGSFGFSDPPAPTSVPAPAPTPVPPAAPTAHVRPPEPLSSDFTFTDFTSFANPSKQKPMQEPKDDSSVGTKSSYSDGFSQPNNNYASNNNYPASVPDSPRSYASDTKSVDPRDSFRREEQEKQDILIKLQQLENKGVRLSRSFTMKTPIDDLRFELSKQKSLIEEEESVKFMRNALITFVHGVEILNKKFDPIGAKLTGWSNSVMEDIGSYEGIFQRLHEKYRGSVEMAPELELLLALVQSAFMFHLMETMFKGAIPNLGSAIASDPNLVNGLARAAAKAADQGRQQQAPQPANAMPMGGPSFNLGEMLGPLMGGLMGGMGGGGFPQAGFQSQQRPVAMPMGGNMFREAMQNPPPQPQMTRERPMEDDSDRFSLASSTSGGSMIQQAPTIQVQQGPKGGKKKTLLI